MGKGAHAPRPNRPTHHPLQRSLGRAHFIRCSSSPDTEKSPRERAIRLATAKEIWKYLVMEKFGYELADSHSRFLF